MGKPYGSSLLISSILYVKREARSPSENEVRQKVLEIREERRKCEIIIQEHEKVNV